MFKVFEQTEIGKKTREGTGLGLPISRKFLQLMGSDMHVESEKGRGATFTFEIQVRVTETPDIAVQTSPRRHCVQSRDGKAIMRTGNTGLRSRAIRLPCPWSGRVRPRQS